MNKCLFALIVAIVLALPTIGQARNTQRFYSLMNVINEALEDGSLDNSVLFYLKGQRVQGKVVVSFSPTVSRQAANKCGSHCRRKKADQSRCDWAARTALHDLQNNALSNRANAVLELESVVDGGRTADPDLYECRAGRSRVYVELRGIAAIVK